MNPRTIWTVFRFECGRAVTFARLSVWVMLGVFPATLLVLVQNNGAQLESDGRAAVAMFILIPELLCCMNLLLAAAPLIYAELEGKTWTYLAINPAGKAAILLGKYCAAVLFTVVVGWFSLAFSLIVAWPDTEPMRVAAVLAILVPLASMVYGAAYVFIGVIFLRRAMVAAVIYTIISEVLIGFIPALINQLTMQYHLRSLLAKWIGWGLIADPLRMNQQFVSDAPAWQHVAFLLGAGIVFLAGAITLLRRRELALAVEV
jgi:ABC-type transport system involved in multi-copper enzyme maturation permease subunit